MTTRQCNLRCLRSDVWKYFDKVGTGNKSVTCKVCKQKFAFYGGTTNLRDHLQRTHVLLAERLQVDALSLSLMTDIWTSSSTKAYISLTCHFLTSQWEFVDCILVTKCFPGYYTGEIFLQP